MEEFDENEFVVFRGADRLAYETRNGETVCIEDELPFKSPGNLVVGAAGGNFKLWTMCGDG